MLLVIAPGRENLSSSSVLKRSERKEAVPVTRRTLRKLTGLRAWNFYLMPKPPSRHQHVFISRHLNTYKEVHGNVYGNATATLPTIPLSFGALWSILSEARRGSFPPLPSVILSDLLCSRTSKYVVQDGIIAALCSAMPPEALIISCARR